MKITQKEYEELVEELLSLTATDLKEAISSYRGRYD